MNLLNWVDGELLSSVRNKIMTMFAEINREGTNISPTAPTPTVAGQIWTNVAQGLVYQRNTTNTDWVVVRAIDLHNSGIVYACYAYSTGNPLVTIAGAVTYNVVTVNEGNCLNPATGVYTVKAGGLYRVSFDGFKDINNSSTEVRLYKNGLSTDIRIYMDSTSNSEYENGHMEFVDNFNAGDTINIRVMQGALHRNENCYFSVYALRL